MVLTIEKKYTPNSEEEDDHWQGTTSDDTDMIVLHRFFDKHADKIGKELLSLSKPSADGDITAINGKRAWDGLCALLVDLGSPLEVPRPSTLTSSDHREYLDLMARYAHRNTESMKRLFVETDVPSVRVPLISQSIPANWWCRINARFLFCGYPILTLRRWILNY
jgi:hypothetical protein